MPTDTEPLDPTYGPLGSAGPVTWTEYYHAMHVFALMPEDATKGQIRQAIQHALEAKRRYEENTHG